MVTRKGDDNMLYSSSLCSLEAETESFLEPGARQVASSLVRLPVSSLHSSMVTVNGWTCPAFYVSAWSFNSDPHVYRELTFSHWVIS